MALTKDKVSITQLTASGTSTSLDGSGAYAQVLLIRHSNGSGTPTVAAIMKVQTKGASGTFTDLTSFTASLTAAQADHFHCSISDAVTAVQIVYTQPTGPTSYTLDADLARITSL